MAKINKSKRKKGRGGTIKLVVKSNELVEARYMFDVWETRFFHSLIANIHKDDEDEKVYRLWFKDIKKNFQLKSNQSYDYLREAAISMASKSVYIGWQNDKFRRGKLHRIIRFVDFLEKGQKGDGVASQEYVDVSIDKDIRPYLLDIKKNFNPEISRYTSYDLRNIIKLKPYAARVYELLKQMEYKGFRTIVVADLKDMFEITNEYPRFSNFYQKVILASIKAINQYTDLTIPIENIEKIKKGRKVHALRFQILSKKQAEMDIILGEDSVKSVFKNTTEIETLQPENEVDEINLLYEEFGETVTASFGVTASAFKKLLKTEKYKKQDVEQAIRVTRHAKYNQEIKKNIAGFFLKALKEGYTDAKIEAEKRKKQKEESEKQSQELKVEILELKDAFSKAINNRIREITQDDEAITEKAIEAILMNPLTESWVREKEVELGRALEVQDYREDERLRGLVINNIIQMQQDLFEDIMNTYHPRIREIEERLKKK